MITITLSCNDNTYIFSFFPLSFSCAPSFSYTHVRTHARTQTHSLSTQHLYKHSFHNNYVLTEITMSNAKSVHVFKTLKAFHVVIESILSIGIGKISLIINLECLAISYIC